MEESQKKSETLKDMKDDSENLKELIKRMQKPVALSKTIAGATVFSIFILWMFWIVSNTLNDWTWFARSGSILVCIGVLTATFAINRQMKESEAPKSFVFQSVFLEASIIIVGTIVWGFGDLFHLLM